jgi:hypothetical protein
MSPLSMVDLQKRITVLKVAYPERLKYPFKQKKSETMMSQVQRLKGDFSFIIELKQTYHRNDNSVVNSRTQPNPVGERVSQIKKTADGLRDQKLGNPLDANFGSF